MKIKPEHFDALKALIEPLDTAELRAKYLAGDFPRSAKCKDVYVRYRWDLVYYVPQEGRYDLFMDMYRYMNDDNIDTALRRIVPPLET